MAVRTKVKKLEEQNPKSIVLSLKKNKVKSGYQPNTGQLSPLVLTYLAAVQVQA
jgi:hypothetical protein